MSIQLHLRPHDSIGDFRADVHARSLAEVLHATVALEDLAPQVPHTFALCDLDDVADQFSAQALALHFIGDQHREFGIIAARRFAEAHDAQNSTFSVASGLLSNQCDFAIISIKQVRIRRSWATRVLSFIA